MSLVKYLNGLWSKAPWLEWLHDMNVMFVDQDDFATFNSATSAVQDWVETAATAGTAAIIAAAGGLVELDAASGTADQGIQIQRPVAQFYAQAGRDIFFEARIGIADAGSASEDCQIFIGLATVDTTVFASGELSATDYIGFSVGATDQADSGLRGKLYLKTLAGGSGTASTEEVWSIPVSADGQTHADVTFVRLGFHVYHTPSGSARVQAYVNGERVGDPITLEIPTGGMAPTFACLSEGGADPIMYLDWFRAAQVRTP